MNTNNAKTINDFVIENIASAEIFKKYGINYSNNSTISLKKYCKSQQIQYKQLIFELNNLSEKVSYLKNYNVWELELLITFLIEIDHTYKKENIAFIEELSTKIFNNQSDKNTDIEKLVRLIHKIVSQIQHHIALEEKSLFPYILYLNSPDKNSKNVYQQKPILKSIIRNLEIQHHTFGILWSQLKEHTNHYQPSEKIDNNLNLLLYKLRQFEEILNNHTHIENNILFPKALALENSFFENLSNSKK